MLDLVVNRVPLAIRRAITHGEGKLIMLYEADRPDGYVRAWSGVGALAYSGQTWFGFGDLVDFDGIGGSRRTEVRVVTVTLAGVNARQLKFVNTNIRGRLARLSLAALRPGTRRVNGDVFSICTGTCDAQDHILDAGPSAKIMLTVNQPVFIMGRAPNLAWTPDWLKSQYGQDVVGLDDVPGVAARIESWLPAS